MNSKQLLRSLNNLFKSPLNQQTRRYYGRDPFPDKVSHYLYRAKLIDDVRLALRSGSGPDTTETLSRVLGDRLLDGFVVSNALRSAPSADAALYFVEALERVPRFSHDQNTVYSLATVLAKSRRSEELKALIADVSSGKFAGVRVSFMNLMQWHAAAGDLDSVLKVWEEYKLSGDGHVCTESYNLVMRLYAQMGNHSEAVNTFYGMIDEGAIPNCRTYKIMIEHLAISGMLSLAMEIFFLLPSMRMKRTSAQYLLLVEGFVAAGRFDKVMALLDEMRADGILPGLAMRFSLERMREAGFVEESGEFLREMVPDERIKSVEYCDDGGGGGGGSGSDDDVDDESEAVRLKPWLDPRALASALAKWRPEEVSALEAAGFVWTSRFYCKVIRNFKSPETAWKLFCWVACQPGFTHDIYTVQRTMTVLARHGQVELVDKLMSKIRSEGMKLPFCTIRLIVDFFGLSKNGDAALKVFRYNRDLCGPISEFNLMVLYSSLVRTLTKCGMSSDAMDVLDEMVSQGVTPDIQTFSGLMHHFAKSGDIGTVQKLFAMVRQSRVEPDGYMFKVLIQAYCNCERAALAWRVFEDLRSLKLMPDAATKELLVNSLWKEGKRIEAAAVEESCREISSVLPLRLRGHIWTVCSADLTKVFDIYSNSFRSNGS